jgi:hypothetical protein
MTIDKNAMPNKERLARKYYAAYGNMCSDARESFTKEELAELRLMADILFMAYKKKCGNDVYNLADNSNYNFTPMSSQDAEMKARIAALETTIATFIHDIDNHDDSNGEITMSSLMWLQVEAFRNLVGNV